jgi:curved DNA-binding protein CbpA
VPGDPVVLDAYAELGVARGDDDVTITAAYRRLAHEFHPDIAGEDATDRMSRINAAYDRIRDEDRRVAYDAELRAAGVVVPGAGRSGADPSAHRWNREPDGTGGAGPPPGHPSGSVLPFGRHIDWSIGEIARVDPGYLVWLEDRREGQPYRQEIDQILRRSGYRHDPGPAPTRSRPGRRRTR